MLYGYFYSVFNLNTEMKSYDEKKHMDESLVQ